MRGETSGQVNLISAYEIIIVSMMALAEPPTVKPKGKKK
jgi:hypothetical protein